MPHPGWSTFRFEGIGTQWEISTPDSLVPAVRSELLETVAAYDKTWSRFRTDSLVSGLSRSAGKITLPGHAVVLQEVYSALYRLTGGAMTPTRRQQPGAAGLWRHLCPHTVGHSPSLRPAGKTSLIGQEPG